MLFLRARNILSYVKKIRLLFFGHDKSVMFLIILQDILVEKKLRTRIFVQVNISLSINLGDYFFFQKKT